MCRDTEKVERGDSQNSWNKFHLYMCLNNSQTIYQKLSDVQDPGLCPDIRRLFYPYPKCLNFKMCAAVPYSPVFYFSTG